ncbi:glutamine amidotransferase [Sulfurovum sp. zt1-1]|uniref:Glutamine amidotransferase n=1 Tax=Sulfurovum zhangzhouensis TaxID=3019067 RepID=A0ABT7QXZ2_9BACT|nr:glutamine amidotransferase [Sulfurovum zhangzhouensis]MDM5271648.1 glutamine amidotransferase [Sulfurovum zhangzhouensis]
MKDLYIFKVGKTFEKTKNQLGDFDDWVRNSVTTKDLTIKTIDILKGEPLPPFTSTMGVVITGSHAMVTEEHHWSLDVEEWIRQATKHPIGILGICYGHQLIGKALGGKSDFNPKGKEIGTVTILTNPQIKEDPLFKNAPATFSANVTHLQSVLTLPKGAEVLGYNSHDNHQIVRYGQFIWGVQFHPEYDVQIINAYIEEQREDLIQLGFSPEKLIKDVTETVYTNTIIDQFIGVLSNQGNTH